MVRGRCARSVAGASIPAMITDGSAMPTLCCSVVVHNSDLTRLAGTLQCLAASLQRAVDCGAVSAAKVVVHDNQSCAQYRAALSEQLGHYSMVFVAPLSLTLNLGDTNFGYGAGVNRAFFDSDSDWALVLNPDIELAENALEEGLQLLSERETAVAVSPLCRGGSGRREYLCKRYPAILDLLLRGFGWRWVRDRFSDRLARYEYQDLQDSVPSPVTLVGGACMLIRRQILERVDGFDESFFMYFEDFDLSLRLGIHGELLYLPSMQVVHHGGFAARKGWRHILWFVVSATRFYRRHGWRWL